MMRVRQEARGVFVVGLYERDVCEQAVNYLKGLDGWVDAPVVAAGEDGDPVVIDQPDMRRATILAEPYGLKFYKDFEAKLSALMMPLIKDLWGVDLTLHSEIQIVRYGPGGHYKPHADGGYFKKERYFTVLCYMNDDFEGGSTSFPSLGYNTKPRCGDAILFPARYVHCAEPVVRGEKFILVCWVHGPIPVEWI